MRRIRSVHFPARYRSSRRKRGRGRRLLLLAGALAILWSAISEAGLSSVSKELTEEAARNYLLRSVNQAVDEALGDRENSFVSVRYDGGGAISAVTADTAALNRLKSAVLGALAKDLDGKVTARVSLGSLTGVRVWNGRGPKVPVKLDLEGSADVAFATEFSSAGINQSCHRLTMTVTVRAHSQSRRFETAVEVETATVLAETVLVGETPNFALTRTAAGNDQ